jgi:hypothetical protein
VLVVLGHRNVLPARLVKFDSIPTSLKSRSFVHTSFNNCTDILVACRIRGGEIIRFKY